MPTSNPRHPSRDALLRDSFGQLREQRGVSVERFARTLNAIAHAMCPIKTADLPCLDSFTTIDADYDHAVMSWNKRVQRWASGAVEFPAWLEEPWATALEELGDTATRVALARRHGFMGVRRPEAGDSPACAFAALGAISTETGDVMSIVSEMLRDGSLNHNDIEHAPTAKREIDDAISALMGIRRMIEERVEGKAPLKAVQ